PGTPPAAPAPEAGATAGDAPEGVFPAPPAGDLTANPYSTGPAPTAKPSFTKDDGAGEPHDLHDLSGTSPANGANGRHSAG
ncbi:hypothetical protein JHN52_26790, partial [Streptomyces sp. MBT97]|nr:hypothetical protein [Streptomyces sp. MBT97]